MNFITTSNCMHAYVQYFTRVYSYCSTEVLHVHVHTYILVATVNIRTVLYCEMKNSTKTPIMYLWEVFRRTITNDLILTSDTFMLSS